MPTRFALYSFLFKMLAILSVVLFLINDLVDHPNICLFFYLKMNFIILVQRFLLSFRVKFINTAVGDDGCWFRLREDKLCLRISSRIQDNQGLSGDSKKVMFQIAEIRDSHSVKDSELFLQTPTETRSCHFFLSRNLVRTLNAKICRI